MLQEIFYWIFNMSITASITGLVVMCLRLIKKLPRRFSVFLWAIPFLRMIFPFGLSSPYSIMTLLSKLAIKTIIVFEPSDYIAFSTTNSLMAADSYFPITYKTNILERIFSVASVIWIIVSVAIILMLSVTYFITLREVKDAKNLKDNIYLSKKVISPAVYGIIRPKIILPDSYGEKDIELIVLHENSHIRTADNLWRVIAFLLVALHWFNPFAWLFLKLYLADIELSCDERVIKKIGQAKAKEYAISLLDSKKGTTVFASGFGGAKIRTRIENILSFKKMTLLSSASFITLIGIIFYVLLTNAA